MASADAVVVQGLECCLCFENFNEPKNLSCGHSFCKTCLVRLYESHPQQNQLSCPICRYITTVSKGDISKLQTNILIKSMVHDVKTAKTLCTACDPEVKSPAVLYCAQCHEYMCEPCTKAHGKVKMTKKHDLFSVEDVKIGKVKVKRFCTKHPEEEKLYVCTTCNVSICFRCHMLYHGNPDHEIKEVFDYKKIIQRQIESLQAKATTKIATIEAHGDKLKEQKAIVEMSLDQKIANHNQSYEKAVKHLTRQRNDLIDRCKREKATHITQLERINESDDKLKSRIQSASELVGSGIKALLEGQTLAVHSRICCDLEKMLDERNPDAAQPKSVADHAKRLKFIKSGTPNSLGQLQLSDWQLDHDSTFPLSHGDPSDAVPLSDGRVAVGYTSGNGIEMFTADGPQETVLRGVRVMRVSVLSDGRYVVRDNDNNITLYTQAWEKLNVWFNTLNGGWGGMFVDRDDNIYVGYLQKNKIVIFQPEGGAPFLEIDCHGCSPLHMCQMNHSRRLVVHNWSDSVKVIDDRDEAGTILHHMQLDGCNTRIAVLKDDNILIGCRKGALMSIELYTKDLEKVRAVLRDFPIVGYLYKLVELSTGKVAAVSKKQFIVFHKT